MYLIFWHFSTVNQVYSPSVASSPGPEKRAWYTLTVHASVYNPGKTVIKPYRILSVHDYVMLATRNSFFIVLFTCDMESDFSAALAYKTILRRLAQDKRMEAIRTIYNGRDVFVWLPTYGVW